MKEAELDNCKKIEQMHVGLPDYGPLYSYCALSCIALYRQLSGDGEHSSSKRQYVAIAKRLHKRIRVWVDAGNKNLQHIDFLLEAEIGDVANRRRRNTSICRKNYDLAILQANRWGFIHEEALGHELFGDFLLREQERSRTRFREIGGCGNVDVQDDIDKEAKAHYGRAVQLYQRWGVQYRVNRVMYGPSPTQTPSQSRSRGGGSGWRRWTIGMLSRAGGGASVSSPSDDNVSNAKGRGEVKAPEVPSRTTSVPVEISSSKPRVPFDMIIEPPNRLPARNDASSMVSSLPSIPEHP